VACKGNLNIRIHRDITGGKRLERFNIPTNSPSRLTCLFYSIISIDSAYSLKYAFQEERKSNMESPYV